YGRTALTPNTKCQPCRSQYSTSSCHIGSRAYNCEESGIEMNKACWRLSLRGILILSVCCCLLACGSGNNRAASDFTVSHVSSTKNPLVAKYFVSSQEGGRARVEFGTDTSYGRQTGWYSVPLGGSNVAILVA